jgi:hypothetical protein
MIDHVARIPGLFDPEPEEHFPDGLTPQEISFHRILNDLRSEDRAVLSKAMVNNPEILSQIMEARKREAITAIADSMSKLLRVIDLPIPEILKLLNLPGDELYEMANITNYLYNLDIQFDAYDLREVIDMAHVTAVMEPVREENEYKDKPLMGSSHNAFSPLFNKIRRR